MDGGRTEVSLQSDTVQGSITYIRLTLQREIEKEIIRHEVIAAEIERQRLPEEEARRELMIEREMAMHRAREMGLSIDDRLLMQLHTRYPWFPFSRNLGLGFGHDVLPSTPPHFSHGLWSGLDVNKKDELTMLVGIQFYFFTWFIYLFILLSMSIFVFNIV